MARKYDVAIIGAGAAGMMAWDAAAERFVAMDAMGDERVYAFAFEHADRLWLHRMSGVEAWRRQGGRWLRERRIGAAEGLPALESTGLAVDPQRRVWLGTRRGLFRIDPNLQGSRALLRNFGVREGLLSQELNDVSVIFSDDGNGLDLDRLRSRMTCAPVSRSAMRGGKGQRRSGRLTCARVMMWPSIAGRRPRRTVSTSGSSGMGHSGDTRVGHVGALQRRSSAL